MKCRFGFHKWNQWCDPHAASIRAELSQQRRCLRCNLVQVRYL